MNFLSSRYLSGHPRTALGASLAAMLITASAGTFLPAESHPGALYVFPIFLLTWLFGSIAGLMASVTAGSLWAGSLFLSGGAISLFAALQIGAHVSVYGGMIYAVHRIKANRERKNRQCACDGHYRLQENDIIPICSSCRKIRDRDGSWQSMEEYMRDHAALQFTHGICRDCADQVFRDYQERKKERLQEDKNNSGQR